MSSAPWSIGGSERPRDRRKPLPSEYLDRLTGPCRSFAQPVSARNGGSQGGASSLLEEPRVPGSMKGPTLVQPGLACSGIGVQFPVEYACFQSDPAGDARPLRRSHRVGRSWIESGHRVFAACCRQTTQSGQNDFPKAASQPQQGSANRNAPKLPLATSPNRPIAALQPSVKVIIGQAALLRLQTLMLKVATRIELALST